jgi:hypothetical protein
MQFSYLMPSAATILATAAEVTETFTNSYFQPNEPFSLTLSAKFPLVKRSCPTGTTICPNSLLCSTSCCTDSAGAYLGGCSSGYCNVRQDVLIGCCNNANTSLCNNAPPPCYDYQGTHPPFEANECSQVAPYCGVDAHNLYTCFVTRNQSQVAGGVEVFPALNWTVSSWQPSSTASSPTVPSPTVTSRSEPTSVPNHTPSAGVIFGVTLGFIAGIGLLLYAIIHRRYLRYLVVKAFFTSRNAIVNGYRSLKSRIITAWISARYGSWKFWDKTALPPVDQSSEISEAESKAEALFRVYVK